LNGPSRKGVPFVYNFVTKSGQYSQYLFSTISPVELWAFSTTAEDATLRSQLTDELGSASKARHILASEFPGGSAKEAIEKLVEATSDPSVTKDPYTYLIRELKKKYNMITVGVD
jgi:intracellular multiplication protein IcmB